MVSKHMHKNILAMALLLTVLCAAQDFMTDCEILTKHPHRLSGTAEYKAAADHVASRLKSMAPDELIEQPFAITQTRTITATMRADSAEITLHPMRPNGIIAPVTPEEGVTGILRHIGKGRAEDFDRVPVDNAIVVLDYDSGQGWIRALRLGALAVIFTKDGGCSATSAHYTDANVNLLRFFYDGTADALPADGTKVTLKSSVVWEPAIGRNIFAFFKGTKPVFSQKQEEVLVLATNLDTFGDVPTVAPGARGAANCAALLQIAEAVAKNRPRRHVLIAFFDNQARGHLGSSAFYRALEANYQDCKLEARKKSQENEERFIKEMNDLLAQPEPITARAPNVRRRLLDRLADKAQNAAHIYKDIEYKLNDELLGYRKIYGKDVPPNIQKRIVEISGAKDKDGRTLQEGLLDKASATKHSWNELQRVIGHQKRDMRGGANLNLPDDIRSKLDSIIAEVKKDIANREVELSLERKTIDADERIHALLSDKWIALHASLYLGSTTDKWALIIGEDSAMHSWRDNPGLYGKIQSSFLSMHKARLSKGLQSSFMVESANQTISQTRTIIAAPTFVHSGVVAGIFSIYNLAFGTVQEAAPFDGTPDDTITKLNTDFIIRQTNDIISAICPIPNVSDGIAEDLIGNQEGFSVKRGIVLNSEYAAPLFSDDYSVKGPMVMGMLQGTSLPNTPMPGAIVQVRLNTNFSLAYNENKKAAFDNFQVLRTDSNGVYGMGPYPTGWGARGGFAAIFDGNGRITEVSDTKSYTQVRTRLNTFRANAAAIILPSQQRTEKMPNEDVKILSARANAELALDKSFSETVDGVVSWYSEEREKGVKLFSLRQMVGLNNGGESISGDNAADNEIGEGFRMDGSHLAINAAARSSADLWRLNNSRMDVLSSKGILESSLAEMHGRAEDTLLEAAQPSTTPMRRESLGSTAFCSSCPVYS